MDSIKKKIARVSRRKGNPHTWMMGKQNDDTTVKNSMDVSQKLKNRTM